jgi:hypothetical protein
MSPHQSVSRWKAKLRAGLIHFGASVLVAALVAFVVFAGWYPGPYRVLGGGTALFLILASVDVVMGPVLTLVVYDPAKSARQLARDLVVVVCLQLGALGYGVMVMAQARPAHLVWEVDQFRVIRANDAPAEERALALPELQAVPWWGGPTALAVSQPPAAELPDAVARELAGQPLAAMPKYWRPYETIRADVLRLARPVEEQAFLAPEERVQVLEALRRARLDERGSLVAPLVAQRGSGVVVVDGAGYPMFVVATRSN